MNREQRDEHNDYLVIVTREDRKRIWNQKIAYQVSEHIKTILHYNMGESIDPGYITSY